MNDADTVEAEVPERFRDLVPGRRYRVTMDDCCVQGYFEAMYLGLDWSIDIDGSRFLEGLLFDTAKIGPDWGQFDVEAI